MLKNRKISVSGAFLALVVSATPAMAQDIGVVVYSTGKASVFKDLQDRGAPPLLTVSVGDALRTTLASRMKIVLEEGGSLSLDHDTEARIVDPGQPIGNVAPLLKVEVIKGNIRLVAPDWLGQDNAFVVETTVARFVLQKGDIFVRHSSGGGYTDVLVLDGEVMAENAFADDGAAADSVAEAAGRVKLTKGDMSLVSLDATPSAPSKQPQSELDRIAMSMRTDVSALGGNDWQRLAITLGDQAESMLNERQREAGRPQMPINGPHTGLQRVDRPVAEAANVPVGSSTIRVEWDRPWKEAQ